MKNLCALLLFCVSATLRSYPVFALDSEPYEWKNVKVVCGGYIPGIVFSRAEKGLAFCRTDIGGCYCWDDAAKKWIPMHDSIGESSHFGGESIAPDPVEPNIVYIAAGMYSRDPAAILRSRDRGKSWQIFPVTFHIGGNEDGRGMGERLAIDPHERNTLYFGSRHEGLWRSRAAGETWKQVETFPLKGLGNPAQGQRTHGGLSFVTIDPTGQHIFVGNADPGEHHLYRSDDAGATWHDVPGEPSSKLLPWKGQLDQRGNLFLTYCNGIGPNGVTDGGVWKLNTTSGDWADITPDKSPDHPHGGYAGLSVSDDGQTLVVTTMNRWNPIDTVWRSTDSGKTWHDIADKSTRDVSASPYLYWGHDQPKLGWWMSALAVDPFNQDHVAYATGATMYACDDFSNVSNDQPTHWRVWGEGIEETAIITLMSPTDGAHLLSGFGDINGFLHENLDETPKRGMYEHPMFGNTTTLDYAGQSPKVIVRSGTPHEGSDTLAWSEDGGRSWEPLTGPASNNDGAPRRRFTPAIVVSADGGTFLLATPTPQFTRDRGKTWTESQGLPTGARPVPDRADPDAFYALDFDTDHFYISTDRAATFSQSATAGLPEDIRADAPAWHEDAFPLIATLGKSGDLWFVGKTATYHSIDQGRHFTKLATDLQIQALGFGKAPPGSDYPALYAIGEMAKLKAIWRSDDAGLHWIRINDDQHQYGTRFRCIAGDPRIFGRVYVGTDGRGILYADRR
jgi:hypothetical protein